MAAVVLNVVVCSEQPPKQVLTLAFLLSNLFCSEDDYYASETSYVIPLNARQLPNFCNYSRGEKPCNTSNKKNYKYLLIISNLNVKRLASITARMCFFIRFRNVPVEKSGASACAEQIN